MQHLTLEQLAALVDEPPGADERSHLETCPTCSAELEKLKAQTTALKALTAPRAGSMLWRRVEAGLREEGLITPGPLAPGARSRAWRAAAAVALFLAGSIAGGALVMGTRGSTASAGTPRDAIEAAARLRAAEAEYLLAVSEYAEFADSDEALDPLTRLAALEGILLTTRAALRDAPADPIINNYHLTALGLRDALMRQIEAVEGQNWY